MPQPPIDPALELFAIGTLLLSIVACMNVIFMRRSGPVLPYEPRRPVPWGPVGCILAAMFVLNAVIAAFAGGASDDAGIPSQAHTLSTLVSGMLVELIIVAVFLFAIAMFTKATPRDLGLPANVDQWMRDLCIGGAACLAALAPVHIVQVALMYLCFPEQLESQHPLIKMVVDAPPNRWILFLSGVAAVVVAPICEEIVFRLLLQGWLERWEDERLGWRAEATEMQMTNDEAPMKSDEGSQSEDSSFVIRHSSFQPNPPSRSVAGLPYGWFPIVISSVTFGLAHFGYGPEPVPLLLLGLVLGYLYQRTHRIVPCIVTHALFNLFTMIILWRMIYHHG